MRLLFVALAALCAGLAVAQGPNEHNKVVCYWNSTSFLNPEPGRVTLDTLKLALPYCTHLIYGYAGINQTDNTVMSLQPTLDTGLGHSLYILTTQLKKNFPHLRIYLSVGGNADPSEDTHKYLTVTETPEARSKFVQSAFDFCQSYGFDGIDLAWQFPTIQIQKKEGALRSAWTKIKNTFGGGPFVDEKETEHRQGFTVLVRDLKNKLKLRNWAVTVTVLPNVNASVYYDPKPLSEHVDAVHLMAFDQRTPERDPKEADYPAPVYAIYRENHPVQSDIDSSVRYWLEHGTPGGKVVVGVPTFGRTWRVYEKSSITGVPPVRVKGPGAEGPLTRTPGILSYGEVCSRITERTPVQVRRFGDPTKKYGSYAFKAYNPETEADGIWIGYEDPDTAGNKAAYAKAKGLGGVAIFDLSTDDFRSTCTQDPYPIVRAVKLKL